MKRFASSNMPEMRFHIRWPDGTLARCYSPSLVIKEHLAPGQSYPLADFLARSRTALVIASDRVKARYGHACSLALGQLAEIEAGCVRFTDIEDAHVRVERFEF
jgi:uncharacterized repeat protein (TIGR04042 family)